MMGDSVSENNGKPQEESESLRKSFFKVNFWGETTPINVKILYCFRKFGMSYRSRNST